MSLETKQIYAFLDGDEDGYRFTVHNNLSLELLGAEGWSVKTSVDIISRGRLEGVVFILQRPLAE